MPINEALSSIGNNAAADEIALVKDSIRQLQPSLNDAKVDLIGVEAVNASLRSQIIDMNASKDELESHVLMLKRRIIKLESAIAKGEPPIQHETVIADSENNSHPKKESAPNDFEAIAATRLQIINSLEEQVGDLKSKFAMMESQLAKLPKRLIDNPHLFRSIEERYDSILAEFDDIKQSNAAAISRMDKSIEFIRSMIEKRLRSVEVGELLPLEFVNGLEKDLGRLRKERDQMRVSYEQANSLNASLQLQREAFQSAADYFSVTFSFSFCIIDKT